MIAFLFSLVAVLVLVGIAVVGVWGLDLRVLFGVVIPYAAVLTFFVGLIWRILDWAKSPVPFRIPNHLRPGEITFLDQNQQHRQPVQRRHGAAQDVL